MTRGRTSVLIGLAAILAAAPADAYYHYVHYLKAPYNAPVFEKFDLSKLPNKTLTFFVSDQGPAHFGTNDDFASVLSQVRQAAMVWDSVDSSDLRVAFGGVESPTQAANVAGGDVVFVDLGPGVLGMGGVSSASTTVDGPNGTFFPVNRSIVQLTNDTSRATGPSYLERFFTTAVHEMGHALGLQHTFTDSAMSYSLIRNTSRARPLDQDDIASVSLLYPKAGYLATVGSITGRVTSNGQPVAGASVVAITPSGPAVSNLTNPDGTYRIDGLLPARYWVYVHPLPPDADIRGPYDPSGQTIPTSGPFETLFYPGTRDVQQFSTVGVDANSVASGVDFSVGSRKAVPMYDITTYSYSDAGVAASPAFVNATKSQVSIVAQAFQMNTPVPQSVTVLGGFASPQIQFQSYNTPTALAIYLQMPLFVGTGPRHILFNFGNDMYVLPNGLNLVQRDAPAIASVTANGDGTVTVAGSNFGLDSRVYFDGLPAANQAPVTGDAKKGSIVATPPPGYSAQNANVIVYNLADGQNSTMYQTQGPPTYTYPSSDAPQVTFPTTSLSAGVSAEVDLSATNMNFADGQVTLGFGTSDIAVRRVWVKDSNHLVANISIAPGAVLGNSELSVISGFQTAFLPAFFQTTALDPTLPQIALPLFNNDQSQAGIYPGAVLSMFGSNLVASANNLQVTVNDVPAQVLFSAPNQINFVVPAKLAPGLATLKLNNGSTTAPVLLVQIDPAPPAISTIANTGGQALDTGHVASSGDVIVATVTGVDPSVIGSTSRVRVFVSGVEMSVLQITAGSDKNTVQVAFLVGQSFGGLGVPVVVSVDGTRSSPYSIVVK